MKSVVIGASAGLGRALAEQLASRGHNLFLTASDDADLNALSHDLQLRYGVKVLSLAFDLNDRDVDPGELKTHIVNTFGLPQNLFFIAGVSYRDDNGSQPSNKIGQLLSVNLMSPIQVINAMLPLLENTPSSNIVGIGSVASIRPRRSNMVYGAAKTGLESYFGSLRHYLAAKQCRTQFYRSGYLHTQMTFGQKLPLPALSPQAAAKIIAANLDKDLGVVYLPWWWKIIALCLNTLPWSVFKKLNI